MPDVAALLRAFARTAATIGLAAAAAAAVAGCEPPQCGTSRTDELSAHLGPTFDLATDFELKRAAEEAGRGIGLVPHPVYAMPGLMMPVSYPSPAPTPPPAPTAPPAPELAP